MRLTDVRIKLCDQPETRDAARAMPRSGLPARLRAYCALTFDGIFVVRDVKLIEGYDGLFLAMPSRKLCDHCPRCGEKNHLRAAFCNHCGSHLDENRYLRHQNVNGSPRLKLHADIAHPISADCRQMIEHDVFAAYQREIERSRQPGYVAPNLNGEDVELHHERPASAERGVVPASVAASGAQAPFRA